MELETQNWKEFNLLTICKIDMGNKLDNNKMTHYEPGINFISRTANNNGVSDVVDPIANIPPYPVNSVTVALGGSIGSCFLQTKNFYTGQNVSVLSFDEKISNYAKLFVMTIFMHECKYKYVAFGRELNVHIRKDFMLYLPSKLVGYDTKGDETTPIYEPDWQFMEDYIKSLQYELPETQIQKNQSMTLDVTSWKEFRLGDLFDVQGTTTTKVDTLTEEYGIGEHPYITTQATNNGTAGYYNYYTENGNVLVADSAVVGYVSYQPKCFSASDHVEKLMPKFEMNKYNALFLVTVLNRENYRYSYGRKFNQTNIKNTIIKLPSKHVVDETGKSIYKPDWQFMEDYIKSLPYSDLI
jgi:hypothetical protein